MNGRGYLAVTVLVGLLPVIPAHAQVNYQPTPAPQVTAEREVWYQDGEPVIHAGNVYYPAGPRIHFMPFEMARSGLYKGIPLYTRTTLEPLSIVFVPVGRGLMQPYERRRDGDLAGTVGSQAPSFPVTRVGEPGALPGGSAPPPVYRAPVLVVETPVGSPPVEAPEPVGTSGTIAWPVVPAATLPARKDSANALFIEHDGRRWFSAGEAITLDTARLTRAGDYHGFPVYRRAGERAIYIPISKDPGALLAKYEGR